MKTTITLCFIICVFQLQAQWTTLNSGTTNELYDLHFPSMDTGYVVGYYGTALKTTDAGTTWNPLTIGTFTNLNAVHFLDNNLPQVIMGRFIIQRMQEQLGQFSLLEQQIYCTKFSLQTQQLDMLWGTMEQF